MESTPPTLRALPIVQQPRCEQDPPFSWPPIVSSLRLLDIFQQSVPAPIADSLSLERPELDTVEEDVVREVADGPAVRKAVLRDIRCGRQEGKDSQLALMVLAARAWLIPIVCKPGGALIIKVKGSSGEMDLPDLSDWLTSKVTVMGRTLESTGWDPLTPEYFVPYALDIQLKLKPQGKFAGSICCTWTGPTSFATCRVFQLQVGNHLVVSDLLALSDKGYFNKLRTYVKESKPPTHPYSSGPLHPNADRVRNLIVSWSHCEALRHCLLKSVHRKLIFHFPSVIRTGSVVRIDAVGEWPESEAGRRLAELSLESRLTIQKQSGDRALKSLSFSKCFEISERKHDLGTYALCLTWRGREGVYHLLYRQRMAKDFTVTS